MSKYTHTIGIALITLYSSFAMAQSVPIPAPPMVNAKSYILIDHDSEHIISEYHAGERLEPASITKIMVAYIVFQQIRAGKLKLTDKTMISDKAWRNLDVPGWIKGSRMFAEVGSEVSISDLLHGLIIQSGNDAAIALAEHVAGSEENFAKLMNKTAAQMATSNTHFVNASGWPDENHHSSARDIALMSSRLIEDFPEFYELYAKKRFTFNNIQQNNRNTLLWKDESVDGIKTGQSSSAGYCLTASAKRNGMRLIVVILGAPSSESRLKYAQNLLNYGFRYYETHRLFSSNTALKEIRVWKGDADYLQLGLPKDLFVTIPIGQYDNIKPMLNVRRTIFAPVELNEEVGNLDIRLHDESLHVEPLVSLNKIARGNFFQRLVDQFEYLFK